MSDWGGVFEPVVKHRYHKPPPGEKHPEHLVDHIHIASVVPLTDDEIEGYEEDLPDYELEELTHLGDGNRAWLVEVWFAPEPDPTYFYIVNADEASNQKKAEHSRNSRWTGTDASGVDVYSNAAGPEHLRNLDIPDLDYVVLMIAEDTYPSDITGPG